MPNGDEDFRARSVLSLAEAFRQANCVGEELLSSFLRWQIPPGCALRATPSGGALVHARSATSHCDRAAYTALLRLPGRHRSRERLPPKTLTAMLKLAPNWCSPNPRVSLHHPPAVDTLQARAGPKIAALRGRNWTPCRSQADGRRWSKWTAAPACRTSHYQRSRTARAIAGNSLRTGCDEAARHQVNVGRTGALAPWSRCWNRWNLARVTSRAPRLQQRGHHRGEGQSIGDRSRLIPAPRPR